MRELNDFEKQILTRMANNKSEQDLFLASLLFEFCDSYCIGWDKEFSKLRVAFSPNNSWMTVRSKILDFIVLVQYLEKNNYIGLFSSNFTNDCLLYDKSKYKVIGDFPNISIFRIGEQAKIKFKSDHISFNQENALFNVKTHVPGKMVEENIKLGKILLQLINSTYHPTQTLKEFVKNGFKTKDDIRFKRQHRVSWIAIGVSLFIGIASLLQNCHNTKVIASQQRDEVICSKNDSTLLQSQNRDEIPTTTTP